jgi:rhamnogalacturonan endolyase
MENLGRGVVAIRTNTTQVYIGWRMLGTDPSGITFNVYRSSGGNEATLLNSTPLTTTTDFVDTPPNFSDANSYFVRPVIDGVELAPSAAYTLPAGSPVQLYKSVPLQVPPAGAFMGSSYTYSANDTTVADLDGDGEYEIIVKWDPSNSRDTASTGFSGPCIIDAYKLDGTRLWRINLGPNIRAGAHYTEFLVYDFDGDGKAEMICKTADGSIDGQGNRIGTGDIWVSTDAATLGRTLTGPEYLTVFNGETGAAMQTINYIPGRDPIGGWGGPGGNGNSDSVGNRVDRFNAGIAWLDGMRPSAIMCRGYYGRSVIWAVDWRNGNLTTHWVFDSSQAPWASHPITYPYDNPTSIPQIPSTTPPVAGSTLARLQTFSGQGGHHLFIGDVDGDGKDEVVYHSMVVNSDGTGRFSTGLRHGDAGNLAHIIPGRPGLQVWTIHENEGSTTAFNTPGIAVYDAATGEVIWAANPAQDTGRGRAADIDPNFRGMETWGGSGGTRRGDTGEVIYTQTPSSNNMTVWWDADLLKELEDGISISKWNYTTKTTVTLLTATGAASNNSTKSNPCLIADMLGDWREEVLWRSANSSEMRIYTTTIPATNRFWTFMHDRHYRASVAWQQSSYNQPTDTGFYVGAGMAPQPAANIIIHLDTTAPVITTPGNISVDATSSAGAVVDFAATALDDVSGNVAVSYSVAPGSTFPIGTTTVTVTAQDAYGNTGTATFNVTVSSLSIARSGFTLNRRTGHVVQQVTLKNVGSAPVTGPIYLVLDSLSSNTSLTNGTGTTTASWPAGSPYIIVSSTDLSAGSAIGVSFEFANPASGGITYNPRTLSGSTIP